jgi:hypothetical protein
MPDWCCTGPDTPLPGCCQFDILQRGPGAEGGPNAIRSIETARIHRGVRRAAAWPLAAHAQDTMPHFDLTSPDIVSAEMPRADVEAALASLKSISPVKDMLDKVPDSAKRDYGSGDRRHGCAEQGELLQIDELVVWARPLGRRTASCTSQKTAIRGGFFFSAISNPSTTCSYDGRTNVNRRTVVAHGAAKKSRGTMPRWRAGTGV